MARLRFDRLVAAADYPGSEMVPAPAALLALLALKLLDKERRSHIDDFNFDEALGLFAGLNILPKKSFATDYSYRTARDKQLGLLRGWVTALAPALFPEADAFSLDFHPIPYRGDPTGLDRHYLPLRGKAGPSVLTFFALEQESRCLCYANANLTRADQPGELMRFVEFWHAVTGHDPRWLYFDCKVVDYPELSRVAARGIHFVTIRRRGAAILRRLEAQPRVGLEGGRDRYAQAVPSNDPLHRRAGEASRLRGPDPPDRRGRPGPREGDAVPLESPEETARNVIIRYAGRNRVEDGLGISVNFFHLDCLASEVRLNVDLDAVLTVMANGCYRWLGRRLRGFEKAAPKQLYRLFVETAGTVKVEDEEIVVRFDRRSHNPILREAALDREAVPIPWLGDREFVRLRLGGRQSPRLIIFRPAEIRVQQQSGRYF